MPVQGFFAHIFGNAHTLVYLGILLLAGYAGGRAAHALGAPRISGYIVMGMLISPSILGVMPADVVNIRLGLITDIALGVIAFLVGGSLEIGKLRKLGRQILTITVFEGIAAFLAVTSTFIVVFLLWGKHLGGSFTGTYLPVALVVGALSAATAPAATLAVIHEYRAKGPLTSTLLGVVSLDDALAIILFAFAANISRSLIVQDRIYWARMFLEPLRHIGTALLLGAVTGFVLGRTAKFISSMETRLGVTVGFIFLTTGLSFSFNSSFLLANMAMGFMVVNFAWHSEDVFHAVENIEEPIYAMFFTLAGAHLDLGLLSSAGFLAVLLTISRFSGKFFGAGFGARLSTTPEPVRRYIGYGLLPAAGVAIGLALTIRSIFGPGRVTNVAINTVLASVIINALIAPFFIRHALLKSGEGTADFKSPGDGKRGR